MRKRIYNLQVREVSHNFVFNSPLPFGKYTFIMGWYYCAGNDGIFRWHPKWPGGGFFNMYGDKERVPDEYYTPDFQAAEQFPAVMKRYAERHYSPAARKQTETLINQFAKCVGVPVTSLSHELIEIKMIEANSGERRWVKFSGLPGQGQAYFCADHFVYNDWGHPNVEIKDYHGLVSFAKEMIPMMDKFICNELSDDERLEFLETYYNDYYALEESEYS